MKQEIFRKVILDDKMFLFIGAFNFIVFLLLLLNNDFSFNKGFFIGANFVCSIIMELDYLGSRKVYWVKVK